MSHTKINTLLSSFSTYVAWSIFHFFSGLFPNYYFNYLNAVLSDYTTGQHTVSHATIKALYIFTLLFSTLKINSGL